MNENHWKALAALIVEKSKTEDFLGSLKNEEGEYVDFETGFPKFKDAFTSRLKSRFNYGLKRKGEELSEFIKESFGIAANEDEDARKHLERAIEAIKKDKPDPELTREFLSENDVVKQLISEALDSKGELTQEQLKANQIVQQMLRNAVETTKGEFEPKLKAAQSKLVEWQQKRKQSLVKAALATLIDDAKLNYGDPKDEGAKELALDTLFTLTMAKTKDFAEVEKDLVPADEKGNPLTNNLGFPVTLKDHVLSFSPYKPHKHDPDKGSPSPKSSNQTPNSGNHYFEGMTEEQYQKKRTELLEAKKFDELGELTDAFSKAEAA